MERKILGASAVCLMLALPTHAHAGAATGGATEITQLMNNVELMEQVGQAVETTSNTLMTANATMQQLRNLPDALLKEALGGLPIEKVEKMAQAYRVMSKAATVYRDASQVLRKAQSDSVKLNISPSELLKYKADAAYKYGDVYKQTYEQEQAKLARLADVSKDVQKQAETVKSIDSNVGGIQFLASQNLKLQTILTEMSDSIATANANAAMAMEEKSNAEGDRNTVLGEEAKKAAARDAKIREGLKNINPPSPTNVQMFKK